MASVTNPPDSCEEFRKADGSIRPEALEGPGQESVGNHWQWRVVLKQLAPGLLVVLLAFVVLRARFFRVPYFDDELGYFVRQALRAYDAPDPWRALLGGYAWHPALLEASLVAFWSAVGYSVLGTRLLLCLIAAASIAATAVLGHLVGGKRVGLSAALLLAVSPPFFFHGASATPETLVTLLTVLSLIAVMKGRPLAAAVAVALAALAKSTAILIIPVLLAYWVCRGVWEGKPLRRVVWGAAVICLLPIITVASWFALQSFTPGVVVVSTDSGRFEDSQMGALMMRFRHPWLLIPRLWVRATQLLYFDFRWVGVVAIVFSAGIQMLKVRGNRKLSLVTEPGRFSWITLGAVLALHIAAFALVGIDALGRYLVPALPAFCILVAGALKDRLHRVQPLAVACLALLFLWSHNAGEYRIGRFRMGAWNDHAQYAEMVRTYQDALAYVEHTCPNATIAGNYPVSAMVADPRLGYVSVSHPVESLPDTREAFDGNRDVCIVVGKQLLPAWIADRSLGDVQRFGAGLSEVAVIQPFGSSCGCAQS